EVVLFIDELHTLVGAGAAEGAIDAANILKPALARGEIQCIGATTLNEYRKYIEKDAALERRFQPVYVDQPTLAETIDILNGVKALYEKHHRVTITDAAVHSAAVLSDRYVSDRALPDKAIDLLDEASARGPACRCRGWSRKKARACCAWKTSCTGAWSDSTRRSSPCRNRCGAPGPVSRIRDGRSDRSSSWARPVSARPSWRARWRSICSAPRTR